MPRREGIKPIVTEHMRGESQRSEHVGESRVADVQSAGECAEGRHYQAPRVCGKTTPAHGAATMRQSRCRMQMPGDLAVGAARKMSEHQRSDRQSSPEAAADAGVRFRIVVAGDPDPIARTL